MNRISDMYMKFNGVRDSDVGARLIAMPTRQVTALRGDKVTIPGRAGFLLATKGWQEITIKADIAVPDNSNLPAVKAWLRGRGQLIFGDFPTRYYDAVVMTVTPMQSITKRLEGQKMTVTFTCQPFMRAVTEDQVTITSGSVFSGLGDVESEPLVKVEGSGAQTLTINGRSMNLTLTSGTPLFIDNEAGTAYTIQSSEYVFAGDAVEVDDDWFELRPFYSNTDTTNWNNVTLTNGITRVTITPRWRWL